MLKKGVVHRPSMSQYLPSSWQTSDKCQTIRTSSLSANSTCSGEEADVFSSSSSSSESETDAAEIEEEGESKLAMSKCASACQPKHV